MKAFLLRRVGIVSLLHPFNSYRLKRAKVQSITHLTNIDDQSTMPLSEFTAAHGARARTINNESSRISGASRRARANLHVELRPQGRESARGPYTYIYIYIPYSSPGHKLSLYSTLCHSPSRARAAGFDRLSPTRGRMQQQSRDR